MVEAGMQGWEAVPLGPCNMVTTFFPLPLRGSSEASLDDAIIDYKALTLGSLLFY